MSLQVVWSLHREGMLRIRDYLPMVPVVLFFSLASQQGISELDQFLGWLVVNVLSLLATAVVFWVSRLVIRRPGDDTVSLGQMVFIGAVLGGVKGATTGAFGALGGLEPDLAQAVSSRVFQATLLGAVVVGGISIAAQARHLLSEHRRVAIASALSDKLNSLHHFEEIDAPVIRQALTHTRSALARAPRDSATLREIAESVVRPLSHELWRRQRRSAPTITLRSVYWRALRKKTYAPVLVGLIWWITVFPALAQRGDPVAVVVATVAVASALTGVLWLVSRFVVSGAAWGIVVVAAGFALVIWSSVLVGQALLSDAFAYGSLWDLVSLWLWALIITIGVTTVQAVTTLQKDSAQRLGELLTDKDITTLTAQSLEDVVSNRLATFLHGEVVNKLQLLAQRGTSADRTVDDLAEETTTNLLRQLDSSAWLTGARHDIGSLEDRLRELADNWRGIIDLTVELPTSPIRFGALEEANLIEALGEAVANAYRHGMATAVSIHIERTQEGDLTALITDNGLGPRGGERGVGSGIYDHATGGRWTLSTRPEGTGSILNLTLSASRDPVDRATLTSE